MKIITWNVNGIRACINKGLLSFIKNEKSDVYCFQEIKISALDFEKIKSLFPLDDYKIYVNHAEKKGYSGVMTLTRIKPLSIKTTIGDKILDAEGRVLVLEYKNFHLINAYFPNSQHELLRLDDKIKFNNKLFEMCRTLTKKKPVIICGDFNVAHKEIDIANPKQNEGNAGFTLEERNSFDAFLKEGYVDVFRNFVPDESGHYTWWSYRFDARKKNIGWRIDYFIADPSLKKMLKNVSILKHIHGSDHCPVSIEIKKN